MKLVYSAIASLCCWSIATGAMAVSPLGLIPVQVSQATSTADLPLLAKVIQQFLEHSSYETNSEIRVSSIAGNTTVQTSVTVKTIAQHPNKFRSEITFAKPEQPGAKVTTLVISDGQQVWLYRPDLQQYQMMTYSEFEQFDESYWLGFSAMIYSQIPADVRQAIQQDGSTSTQIVQAVGLELKDLQGAPQTIDNRPLYVYRYRDAREGSTFTAWVEPSTAVIQQMQIAGRFESADVTINERIISRTAKPAIAPNLFTFSPPPGTKKVKVLAIGPL